MAHHFRPSVASPASTCSRTRGHGQQPQGSEELSASLNILRGVQPLQTDGALPKLGMVEADCVPPWEGPGGRAKLEAAPELRGLSPGAGLPRPRPGRLPWRSRECEGGGQCGPALSWPPWHPSWGLKGRVPPSHRCWTSSVPTCSLEAGRGRDAEKKRETVLRFRLGTVTQREDQDPVLLITI